MAPDGSGLVLSIVTSTRIIAPEAIYWIFIQLTAIGGKRLR